MGARGTAPSPAHPAVKAKGQKQDWTGYLFISPAVALFLMLIVGPFTFAIFLSFYSWDLLTPRQFIGLDNFREMWQDPLLRKVLRNTFVFAIASVVTHVVGAFVIALGVNQLKNRYLSYFVRTSLFFPFVISWAAVAPDLALCPEPRRSGSFRTTPRRSASPRPTGSTTRRGRCRRSSASTGGTRSGSRS